MMERAYRLWARQVNGGGGLLGRPVELIIMDDESSPETAVAAYRRMIKEMDVDLVLSPYGTPISLAVAEVTETAGYPLIASASASDALWEQGHSRVFGMYALARRYFIGFLDLLARNGYTSIALIHEQNEFNEDCAGGTVKWAAEFGVDVVSQISIDASSFRPESVIGELRELNPDGLVVCTYPDAGYAIIEEMQRIRFRPAGLAFTIIPVHPDFDDLVGAFANGIFAPSQWEPDERIPFPGTADFVEEFTTFVEAEPSYHAGSAYASCQILEMALEHVGEVDHSAIAAYIASLDTVTVIGRFKTDASGKQIGRKGKRKSCIPAHCGPQRRRSSDRFWIGQEASQPGPQPHCSTGHSSNHPRGLSTGLHSDPSSLAADHSILR
jgi:branched-chain amino acid transport system substrate-binding protein